MFPLLSSFNKKIFREEGQSVKSTKREKLQTMLKYCKENKNDIKYVIFWKYERFVRKLKEQIDVIDYLENLDIEVMSATEPNEKIHL